MRRRIHLNPRSFRAASARLARSRAARRFAAQRRLLKRAFREEVANAVSHGVGLVLALAAVPVLVALAAVEGSALHVVGFGVYGLSLVGVYASSTAYHAVRRPRVKRWLLVVDHAAIYLLIAGTYTPVLLLAVGGRFGWTMLALVWALALGGVVFKLFFAGRYKRVSLATYLGLGWLAVFAIGPLLESMPTAGVLWIAAGGLCYSAGVIFFAWEKLAYNHAIWHGFVMAGSACHFAAIAGWSW